MTQQLAFCFYAHKNCNTGVATIGKYASSIYSNSKDFFIHNILSCFHFFAYKNGNIRVAGLKIDVL